MIGSKLMLRAYIASLAIVGAAALLFAVPTTAAEQGGGCADARAAVSQNPALDSQLAFFRTGALHRCGSTTEARLSPSPASRPVGVFYPNLIANAAEGASSSSAVVERTAPRGSNIVAGERAIVVAVVHGGAQGDEVLLDNSRTARMYYAGLEAVALSVGDAVQAGDTIGRVSSSGRFRQGRWLPANLFSREAQSTFSRPSSPQLLSRVETNQPGDVSLWVDGMYVAELNASNGYAVQLEGLRAGRHYIRLDPDNIGAAVVLRTRVQGSDLPSLRWTPAAVQIVDVR